MAAALKPTKKRSASTQNGPSAKKVHLEKPSGKTDKKRSHPVTLPVRSAKDSEDTDDEDEGNWVDEDEGDDFGLGPEDGQEEGTPMEVDARPTNKDPNAARESHKAQKVLHNQRRAAKPHSDLLADAKRSWALLRQKNIPSAERQTYVKELMDVIRGKVKEIVFKHDASRIVQSVVKYGGQKERDEIAVELKGRYKELAQNRYSKFLVTKLIRLCPTHRQSILLEFQSHVIRLLLHREATSVLADAFELYANAYERSILLRDFYGKETLLFTPTSDIDKEQARKGLVGVLEGADEERRKRILAATKDNLTSIFNNEDKGAVTHAVVHRALWEYLVAVKQLGDEADRERRRREIFELCQETLAELVHTKDGSRVVRDFLAEGSAKDRKQILKVLKPHVERMSTDDEAQFVLFTALDVIDDTKLLNKSVTQPLTATSDLITSMTATPQGRRSLFHLLVPRTRRHFTPAQIGTMAETDEARSRTSKKTSDVREAEVRNTASEGLLKWVEKTGASSSREPGGCLAVGEIMLYADGDKSEAIKTLLTTLKTEPYPSPDPAAAPHPIDLPHTSRMYKTLLQGGHFNHTTKAIEPVPKERWDAEAFAVKFVELVGQDRTVGICIEGEGNGCFLVAELVEALLEGKDAMVVEARKTLKSWFGKEVKKSIEDGGAKGKKVLVEKLARL